jgi:hypothetical protein
MWTGYLDCVFLADVILNRAHARTFKNGRGQLVSRNGHVFASFAELGKQIAGSLRNTKAVLDGEIVCVDESGKPQFRDLLFHRGTPRFFAFDLLLTCSCPSPAIFDLTDVVSLTKCGPDRRVPAGEPGDYRSNKFFSFGDLRLRILN